MVKAGIPKIVPYTGIRPIEAGTPKVVVIDKTNLKVFTPGEDGIPLPKKYTIQKQPATTDYSIQHGDTIFAPKIVQAIQPHPTPALPPRLTDAAICNIQYLDVEQGMNYSHVWPILEDKSGNLWFGLWCGGVSKYDGKSFTHYTEKEGLSENCVISILEDKSGNLWFGTEGGVNKYDGESFTHYTEKEGLSNNSVRSILEDQSGNLWFGTWGGGVNKYDGKSFTHYTEKEGLSSNVVWSILEDKSGNLWFGTWDGVNKYDGKSFTHYTEKEGLSNHFVWSILEDKSGNLWVGTNKGLNYFEFLLPEENEQRNNINIKVYDGTEDGLKGLGFRSVCFDSKNRLWAGTNKGLTMLDLNKLENAIKPPSMQLNSINLEQSFIDYRMLADIKNSGNDWFIGENKNISLNKVQFTGVAKFYNYPLNLELPYYLNHITFNFSAIDWAAPHKIQYKYKLDGLDKEWSTKTKENKADYKNIPYGTYTFKVKTIGIANVWSEPFEYAFTIHPPWWFTWWAYAMYVVTALLLIFLIFRLRTAKLKQRQKKLEQTVKKRTEKVIKQKDELQEKNEEVTAQRDEITAQKDEILTQRDLVNEQNDKIIQQNKSVTDSIMYASRIQNAILPSEDLIKFFFPKYFILHKPRDIVSGDFYWVGHKDNKIIIACVDCTGHGVPGAFMSMLGTSFLNEVTSKIENIQANEILNELRDQVIISLHQTGEMDETKDGMEMVLCIMEQNKKKIQFSGAHNPLYIIRNSELIEIKGDNMSVGIDMKAGKSFTNHEIEIKKGDSLYMFTDGYADQFGGSELKKFGYRQFKQLLLDIQDRIMYDQKNVLERKLKEWQGDNDQIDDILVMGIKI